MTAQSSITHSLPAFGWQPSRAQMAGAVRIAVVATKRNRHLSQGYFPMTD